MPIYEYQCLSCRKIFETFQKISEEPLAECIYCKGPVQRLISQCSFQLKGTGWYVTDYKRGGATSSSSGNGAKSHETTEAKPEEKKESKTETKKAEATGGTE